MYYYKYNGPQYLDNQKIKTITVALEEGEQEKDIPGIITINGKTIQFNNIKTIQARDGMYITQMGKLNNNQNTDSYSKIEIITELEIYEKEE